MANKCIVPIMIGHGRAVIVTNVTESGLNVSTMCKTETKIIQLLGEMVIKIPDSCVVLGKTFEINKISEMASVSNSLTLQGIEKIETRKIESGHEYKQGFLPKFNNLPKLDNEFEKNNNETVKDLQKIRFEPFTHMETTLIATSSSAILLLISVTILVLVFRCSNRCNGSNTKSDCPRVVVLDGENRRNREKEAKEKAVYKLVVEMKKTEPDEFVPVNYNQTNNLK